MTPFGDTQTAAQKCSPVTGPIGWGWLGWLDSERGRNRKKINLQERNKKEVCLEAVSAYISLTCFFRPAHPIYLTKAYLFRYCQYILLVPTASTAAFLQTSISIVVFPIVVSTAIVYQAEAVSRYTTLYFTFSRVGVPLHANGPILFLHRAPTSLGPR